MRLTSIQLETARAILRAIRDKGFVPTLEELAHRLGLRSVSAVHGRLESLERLGAIGRSLGEARGYWPTVPLIAAVGALDEEPEKPRTLTPEQEEAIAAIAELETAGSRITPAILGRTMSKTRQGAFYHLSALRRFGFVERHAFPTTSYTLTESGREFLKAKESL